VKDRRKEIEAELSAEYRAKDFQDSIAEIPKVAYHPATLLTQMQHKNVSLKQVSRLAKTKADVWKEEDFFSPEKGDSIGSSVNSRQVSLPSRINAAPTISSAHSPQFDAMGQVLPEASLQLAMLKAKSGDTRSLFNLFMADDPTYNPVESSQIKIENGKGSMGHLDLQNGGSLANSDFHFTNMEGSLALDSLEGANGSQADGGSSLLQITDKSDTEEKTGELESESEFKQSEEDLEEEGENEPMANESKDQDQDQGDECKEAEPHAPMPSGSAPKSARIESPPTSAQRSVAHSLPGSAPGSAHTTTQRTPPGSTASLKSAMQSPPVSAPHAATPPVVEIAEAKVDSEETKPLDVVEASEVVRADLDTTVAPSGVDTVKQPTPTAPARVISEVATEEQDASKVSSEITSAFFGDNAPEFEGMTLADVQDDASIDKEEDRTSPQRPGLR